MIFSLEKRFIADRWDGENVFYHLYLNNSDKTTDNYTVNVHDGICEVSDQLIGEPNCIIKTSPNVYMGIENGEIKAHWALFTGKLKINNIPAILSFINMFKRVYETT